MTALLFTLPWLLLAAFAPALFRRRPRIDQYDAVLEHDAPLVSIIVPARNEAETIATLISTLLISAYRNREIIVVDDGSTDGTADIARLLAARGDGSIVLVDGKPLPEGWIGKCWACWQGYQAARGDILLFTDADTRHDEMLLPYAVGAQRATGAALVSLLPRQLMETFWERTVLPQIFMLIAFRYRDMERVNRSTNPRDVIANGQFLLMPRADYEAVGGHEALRSEVVEDLRMAQRMIASKRRIHIAYAESLMETRMYRSLGGIVEGWSKNLALGSRGAVDGWLRPAVPWIGGLAVLGFWVLPPLVLLLGALGLASGAWTLWATIAASVSLLFWAVAYVRYRIPILGAALFPLGAVVTAILFFRSALRGNRVGWRGRTYDLSQG